jgi:hypothetical protein
MEKPGYRKGHVPLDIVEKNVDPQYFEMAVTEHIINHALQHILEENSDIKFFSALLGLLLPFHVYYESTVCVNQTPQGQKHTLKHKDQVFSF